jgi:hypothetical protein
MRLQRIVTPDLALVLKAEMESLKNRVEKLDRASSTLSSRNNYFLDTLDHHSPSRRAVLGNESSSSRIARADQNPGIPQG